MEGPRRWSTLGLVALMALPAVAAAAQPAHEAQPAQPMDAAAWLHLAAEGNLPTDCEVPAATRDLPALASAAEGGQPDVTPNLLETCQGIRPGAQLSNGCTMNFVFTDGASLYIGTAGHCTGSVGQRQSAPGVGQFGTVAYRINGGQGSDFALIRIDAAKVAQVNPTLCVWGGPVAAHTGAAQVGTVLEEYGWGVMTQALPVTRARALVLATQSPNYVTWIGPGSGGDSGAPLVTMDGQAIAIHTHGITPFAGVVGEGGTYIQRALSLARNAGLDVRLVPGSADADAPPALPPLAPQDPAGA